MVATGPALGGSLPILDEDSVPSHTRIHTHVYTRTHARTQRTHTRARTHGCTHARTHARTHAVTHSHTHTRARTQARSHDARERAHTQASTQARTHARTRARPSPPTHTHAHTHTKKHDQLSIFVPRSCTRMVCAAHKRAGAVCLPGPTGCVGPLRRSLSQASPGPLDLDRLYDGRTLPAGLPRGASGPGRLTAPLGRKWKLQ